jgi:hypothetical protein
MIKYTYTIFIVSVVVIIGTFNNTRISKTRLFDLRFEIDVGSAKIKVLNYIVVGN